MAIACELLKEWGALGLPATPQDIVTMMQGALAERSVLAVAATLSQWHLVARSDVYAPVEVGRPGVVMGCMG